jgi:hypothetical protein
VVEASCDNRHLTGFLPDELEHGLTLRADKRSKLITSARALANSSRRTEIDRAINLTAREMDNTFRAIWRRSRLPWLRNLTGQHTPD